MPNRPSTNWSLIVLSPSSPREALLLELEGRLLDDAGLPSSSGSDSSFTELAWELELEAWDELEEPEEAWLLLLEPALPASDDEGRLLELELLPAWLDELDEASLLPELEGRLLDEPAPEELLELPDELELLELEEAETSSEGSSTSLPEADELEEPDELEPEALLELLDELELEELEELPVPMPLSKETVRVLLTTWLSL